jgi:hypothetical protein
MKISKKYILFLQAAVIICMAGFILFYNLTRSRVVVLHSYSSQVPEVLLFNEGFSTVSSAFKNPYFVHTYMNMALAASEEDRMQLGTKIRMFLKDFNPDIIVAVGEEAQEYAARHYVGYEKPRIVFAGIRGASIYGYDQGPNVTGVLEEIPVQSIKDVLAKNYKSLLKENKPVSLYVLGDKSFRTSIEKEYMKDQNWEPFLWKGFKQVQTFDDWCRFVVQLYQNQECAVLLLSGYRHLRIKRGEKETVAPKDVIAWTLTHSPYPLIGIYENHFQDGVPLCLSASAKESGEKAALYVQALIEGKHPKALPLLKTSQFMVGIQKVKNTHAFLKLPTSFEVIAKTNKRYVNVKNKDS